jgi:hypothetical protein
MLERMIRREVMAQESVELVSTTSFVRGGGIAEAMKMSGRITEGGDRRLALHVAGKFPAEIDRDYFAAVEIEIFGLP